MIAMRYAITLPRNYDMGSIHTRIAERGHALDDYPGLLFKVYCVAEAGKDGATANVYAPFYVWANTSRMGQFLWGGDGFQGIEADFGRPRINTWAVTSIQLSREQARTASLARFSDDAAVPGQTFEQRAAAHREQVQTRFSALETSAAVNGLDLATGAEMAFDLLSKYPRKAAGQRFTVDHVSVPKPVETS